MQPHQHVDCAKRLKRIEFEAVRTWERCQVDCTEILEMESGNANLEMATLNKVFDSVKTPLADFCTWDQEQTDGFS